MERTEQMTQAAAPREDTGRACVDWAAIAAGALIATGAVTVLGTFGAALGLGSVSLDPDEGMGFFAVVLVGLWAVLTLAGSNYLGGYIAGRMRRRAEPGTSGDEVEARDGVNGLAVWGVSTVVGALMLGSAVSGVVGAAGSAAGTAATAAGNVAGGVAGAAGSAVGGLAQGAGTAVGGLAQGAGSQVQGAGATAGGAMASEGTLEDMLPQGMANPMDYITDGLFRDATQPQGVPGETYSNDEIRREIGTILSRVIRTGEVDQNDLDYLKRVVAARTRLSQSEVETRVNTAVERAQALRAEAEQRLEQAQARAEELRAQAEQELANAQAEAERLAEEAKQKAIEVAEAARRGTVLTGFALAASALVAAAAAFIGAVNGGRDRDAGRMAGALTHRPLRRR